MKILITGANGFIGKNLVASLAALRDGNDKTRRIDRLGDPALLELYSYDIDTEPALLDEYCQPADFVFHLAGVNRPQDPSAFMTGNFGFTSTLLDTLKKHSNTCPVMLSSSIQATLDNPYGQSKKSEEELLFSYAKQTGAEVLVYRFPNVFGKWCRPNYNSAVATFCHNFANELPITVNDPSVIMNMVYIDDVVDELLRAIDGRPTRVDRYCEVPLVHTVTLGAIVDRIRSFKDNRNDRSVPDMGDLFTKKLYSTYLSYLPTDQFSYPLRMNVDARGSFTEFLKTPDRGQVSVNISHPGIVKGNHWHHSKNEKFLVVSGKGIIRFRAIDGSDVLEYRVSGDKLEVVDIPTGYTHNIENLGDTDMVTIMWANEPFDPAKPDTYYLEV